MGAALNGCAWIQRLQEKEGEELQLRCCSPAAASAPPPLPTSPPASLPHPRAAPPPPRDPPLARPSHPCRSLADPIEMQNSPQCVTRDHNRRIIQVINPDVAFVVLSLI